MISINLHNLIWNRWHLLFSNMHYKQQRKASSEVCFSFSSSSCWTWHYWSECWEQVQQCSRSCEEEREEGVQERTVLRKHKAVSGSPGKREEGAENWVRQEAWASGTARFTAKSKDQWVQSISSAGRGPVFHATHSALHTTHTGEQCPPYPCFFFLWSGFSYPTAYELFQKWLLSFK